MPQRPVFQADEWKEGVERVVRCRVALFLDSLVSVEQVLAAMMGPAFPLPSEIERYRRAFARGALDSTRFGWAELMRREGWVIEAVDNERQDGRFTYQVFRLKPPGGWK